MKSLVLDIGNTSAKLALFSGDQLLHVQRATTTDQTEKLAGFLTYQPEAVIFASVVGNSPLINILQKNFIPGKTLFRLDHSLALPFFNNYASPQTLGNDRLANAAAAWSLKPDENNLIVDAGTCLKFDFISHKNEYLGGSISPGFRMRFTALHTFTDKLPLIQANEFQSLIGTNTEESILSGVYQGMLAEIKGMISNYQQEYQSLNIFFTGGDLDLFAKALKNSIFADPLLTLKGLNAILHYHVS